MTASHLHLLVLKTRQIDRLAEFYSALGLTFTEEKHGDGPRHYAAQVGDLVLELYPLAEDGKGVDTTRLGFAIPDLDATLRTLALTGAAVVSGPKPTRQGRKAVVRDPDGRAVELVQR